TLDDVDVSRDGIAVGGTLELDDGAPAAECVRAADRGAPADRPGEPPRLTQLTRETHLGVAVNVGLVDEALYRVWRAGFMCVGDAHLRALGVELPLEVVAAALPGFPPGTAIGLEI